MLLSGCAKLGSVITCKTDLCGLKSIQFQILWETCLQSSMAAVYLCTYSSLVLPCNLKCLPPPLCGTGPVTTSCVVDMSSSWFQADPHVYPRPSNTWHHGTASHTEGWRTDQVSLSHLIRGLSAIVCQLTAVGFVKLPSSCFLYTFHVA